ncbi:MAG: zinc ribbon domain-containing protein [Betaproteobacteria bacterium]|nr:zinc ribbon domain-containing protein [Betaproteobacteria bacterium]
MPIYAYKCSECGFEQDVMQKMSDAPLTDCPSCGKSSFAKQLTAAGFALKGNGYYATDFKNSGAKPTEAPSPACGTGACPACAG